MSQDHIFKPRFSISVIFRLSLILAMPLAVLLLALPRTAQAQGGIIYVDQDASGPAHDGLSWTTAYTNVREALSMASAGEEIWVAEGTYKLTASGDYTEPLRIPNGVELYGGFAGAETGFPGESSRDQRDWSAHITEFSGDVEEVEGGGGGNYSALSDNVVGRTPMLDGIAITGGNAHALLEMLSNPLGALGNGTVYYVDADASGADDGSSWADAYTDLQDALSDAESGDEIWVAEGTYKPGDERSDTFQLENGVQLYGGFAGKETGFPGESLRDQRDWGAHVTILSGDIGTAGDDSDNCYHVVNSSDTGVGTVLDGFVIKGGNANSYGRENSGGGIYNEDGDLVVRNVILAGNSASASGGGMINRSDSFPILINVAFSGNLAEDGAGMYNTSSNPTLINVTFSSNLASNSGGGMENAFSYPTLLNCILWGNDPNQINDSSGSSDVTYSLVQDGYSGEGNLDIAPQFVDADGADNTAGTLDDDLHLQATSPAIDAGKNSAVSGIEVDLDDNPRRVDHILTPDTGSGSAPIVDMGAYEVPPVLVKSVNDTSPPSGQRITYTLTVINNITTTTLTGAVLSDTLPADLTFAGPVTLEGTSGTPAQSGDDLPALVRDMELTHGNPVTVTFPVTVNLDTAGRTIVNRASLTSTQVTTPLLSSVELSVPPADLSIAKSVTPTRIALPGDPITYTIAFSNTGSPAVDVAITDSLPISVSVAADGVISSGVALSRVADTHYVWEIPELDFGEGGVITITGNFTAAGAGGYTLTNEALIGTTVVDGNETNNSSAVGTAINAAPIADAGFKLPISVGESTTLDSTKDGNEDDLGTYDPDDDLPLTYKWAQTGGPSVSFNPALSITSFTAPDSPTVLTFTLTVTDALERSSLTPGQVVVEVEDIDVSGLSALNSSPSVLSQTTDFTATIEAGSSVDWEWRFGDGKSISGDWVGTYVNVADHTYARDRIYGRRSVTYTAAVTASNSENYQTATMPVTITNAPPVADAGESKNAIFHSTVTLDSSASYDPDRPYHDIVARRWEQVGGVTVTLSNHDTVSPTFTAPRPITLPSVLTFTLTVTDYGGLVDTDVSNVTIIAPIGGYTERAFRPLYLGPALRLWVALLMAIGVGGFFMTRVLRRQ